VPYALPGDARNALPNARPCFEAAPWPEADRLFHGDPNWVGADGASSVALGRDRILWLFGDTWIDPSATGSRKAARMVSNSIGIQTGTDPSRASIRFYWGHGPDGEPRAFIPDGDGERYWFGNGVRVGDRLVLFLNRIHSVEGGLGFESGGWAAWMVMNPDAEPDEWTLERLQTPANPLGVLVGFAALLRRDGKVYAFGSANPVKSHPIYAVRWTDAQVQAGDLMNPEWWAGAEAGWTPDSSDAARWPIFENGASELSIHEDGVTGAFIAVQTVGFGPAEVMIRSAPELEGPWTGTEFLFRPPEYSRPNVMIYSAKAHPELSGPDLAVTYATNTFKFEEHLSDEEIYYPRFVRLMRCD